MNLNSEYFAEELGWIEDPALKKFATLAVDLFPPYFKEVASSSTGKYHSAWSNKPGGLRMHTKAVCLVIYELSDAYCCTPIEEDAALVAGLLHDCVKYGIGGGKHTSKTHAAEGAVFFKRLHKQLNIDIPMVDTIYAAIADHYGKWSVCATPKRFPEEFSKISQLVHIADMVASRKPIDFPGITQENLIG